MSRSIIEPEADFLQRRQDGDVLRILASEPMLRQTKRVPARFEWVWAQHAKPQGLAPSLPSRSEGSAQISRRLDRETFIVEKRETERPSWTSTQTSVVADRATRGRRK